LKTFVSTSPEETIQFGVEIGKRLAGNETIALFGELGAGKTTLVKGIVSGLGIKKRVKSPSFVMITEYTEGKKKVYHIDLYRIKGEEEAEGIGLFDYLAAPGVKIIEWAEKVEGFLPKGTLRITLKICSAEKREITLQE
jgi:tRNA threonylcarbamoyladenosine biosynthesis protein TsaE